MRVPRFALPLLLNIVYLEWEWEINLLRENYFIIKILLYFCIALPRNCNSALSAVLDCCMTFPWGTAQRSCTISRIVRQKNMVVSPPRPGTKNQCVGEGHQQFTEPNRTEPNCAAPPKRRLAFAGLRGDFFRQMQLSVMCYGTEEVALIFKTDSSPCHNGDHTS